MPCLPKSLAAVRTAVSALIRSSDHAGSLYGGDDIATSLNIAANATSDAGIDVMMFLCAFANEAMDEYKLKYDERFGCRGDGNVLYVRMGGKARTSQM